MNEKYYLYIKIHKTGLKYLGYTNRNPHTYTGSGKYWKRHLKKHGYDVITKIIYESDNLEDIKSAGIYYSLFYNVVESDQWANLVLEEGKGGDTSKYINYEKRNNAIQIKSLIERNAKWAKNKNHPFYGESGSKLSKRNVNKMLSLGVHPFQNIEMHKRNNRILLEKGTHNLIQLHICSKCGKIGKGASMFRWHFDNCRK